MALSLDPLPSSLLVDFPARSTRAFAPLTLCTVAVSPLFPSPFPRSSTSSSPSLCPVSLCVAHRSPFFSSFLSFFSPSSSSSSSSTLTTHPLHSHLHLSLALSLPYPSLLSTLLFFLTFTFRLFFSLKPSLLELPIRLSKANSTYLNLYSMPARSTNSHIYSPNPSTRCSFFN